MDPKVKQMWIDALRSGLYKKGLYGLKNLDGDVDAAGILCELAVASGIIPEPVRYDQKGNTFFGYLYRDNEYVAGTATGLPSAVEKWAGISYARAYRIAMKGDKGMSFADIADYVEANL